MSDLVDREELLQLLTEKARAGSVYACTILLAELRRDETTSGSEEGWAEIYGDDFAGARRALERHAAQEASVVTVGQQRSLRPRGEDRHLLVVERRRAEGVARGVRVVVDDVEAAAVVPGVPRRNGPRHPWRPSGARASRRRG
jgi:hypothetical protein